VRGRPLPHYEDFISQGAAAGGEAALRRYYAAYVRIAAQFRAGMVLESRQAIRLLEDIRREHRELAMVISGCVGPRSRCSATPRRTW
jgi:hypothetical protein